MTSNSHTWPDLVTKNLQKTVPRIRFDYINAAVPGYTTENSLLTLRHRVARHRPDLVVIYHSTNNMASITRKFAKAQGIYNDSFTNWLFQDSHLWRYLSTIVSIYLASMDESENRKLLNFDFREASKIFRDHLMRLVVESEKIASLVVLVKFSHRVGPYRGGGVKGSFSPDIALQNMPYMRIQDLVVGYREFNHVIEDVARVRNLVLIGKEDSILPSNKNFTDSFHFSDTGSRLMADRVTAGITESARFQALVKQIGK